MTDDTPRIGLEIAAGVTLALAVAPNGRVVGRSLVDDRAGLSAALAALAASTGVAASTPIAIAATAGDLPLAAEIAAALATALPGTPVHAPVPTGLASAVAETWCGAAAGAEDVAYFAVDKRVLAGVIVGGRPLTGANGRAGAAAWLALNPVEREDYRRAGAVDVEVSAAGIVRRLVWRLKAGDRSIVSEMAGGALHAITAEQIFDAARDGDGVAISVLRDSTRYFGMAAANIVSIVDPALLVLGGTMAVHADLLFDPICAEVQRRLAPAMFSALRIVTARLGADAPAVGATRMAAERRA